jgi:TolB-like protein/Flp pilus assembly protein TadD
VKFIKRNRSYAYLTLAVISIFLLLSVSFTFFTQSGKPKESIAVLPFINTSSDSNAEYLSDGITDSLINTLSRLPNLSVPSRSSVFRYKGQTVTPQLIGRNLNVETILTGNVISDGENFAIQVALVNTRSNQPIWNEQYVGKSSDVLAMQKQIVHDVIDKLYLKLETADRKQLERNYTQSSDAYHLYLKGRYFWNQRNGDAIENSLTFLKQAIDKDPNYALAYSGVADSYILLGLFGIVPLKEAFANARSAAEKSLELDPQLAEAHTSLGAIKWLYDWDWAEADQQFRHAVEINPNSAAVHHWYGLYLAEMGRFDEAVAIEKRSVQLDPLSVIINADLGRVLYYARRYDESIEQFQKAIELDSPKGATAFDITFVYEQKGMTNEWFSAMEQFGSIESHELRTAYMKDGYKGFFRKRTEMFEQQGRSKHFFGRAEDYARIAETDKALEMLNRAFEAREHGMAQIKVNPVLDPLRSDPRFADLLRRMNFEN